MAAARILLLGLGNPLRGDDGAGRAVTRALDDLAGSEIEIREEDGEAAALMELLTGRDAAVLVDCCVSGAPPGTVRRFDLHAGPLPAEIGALSSHGLGLAAALELARALGDLPSSCRVFAVDGACFDTGAALSAAVAVGVAEAAARIRAELATLLQETTHA